MGQKTDAQLTTQAQIIRDETTELANTKQRVYDNLKDIIDSKLNNEDVEAGAVDSVNGEVGVVVLSAADIPNTAAGNIASTTVQAAINELDSEKQANLTAANFGDFIAALTAKTTPIDADSIVISDSAASTDAKEVTFTELKAFLKTYFDSLYVSPIGVQDLFIPAQAFTPRITSGCAFSAPTEFATSLVNINVLAFDPTDQEFAQYYIVFPRKYNLGTITAVPIWTALSGSGTVQWGISGGAYSNDDALTVALGTPQTSDDTLIAANDLHQGPETSAITLAGTPADADLLVIQVSRNPASDTLAVDALLIGLSVRITVNAATDA